MTLSDIKGHSPIANPFNAIFRTVVQPFPRFQLI